MSSGDALQPVEVTDLVTDLQRLAFRLDADAIAVADVAGVVADLGQAKRLVDGMLTTMARRTDTVTLAAATGSTRSQARAQHLTSTRLMDQPAVADAVRRGVVSQTQVDAIADAVQAAPDAAADLLGQARVQSAEDLRRSCRDARAAADGDREATRQRHWRRRACRTWTETDGEWKLFASGPAEFGARFDAALRAAHDRRFQAAHAQGRREEDCAYRFDALFDVLESTSPDDDADDDRPPRSNEAVRPAGSGRQTKVIATVDLAALRRGRVDPGESCAIAGVGQVALSAVLPLIPDAELAVVIRDGVDIRTVTHLGRQVTAHQRTALQARGYECEVPHCRATHLLEIDHVAPWADTHQTVFDQLAWLCRRHHRDKSRDGYRLAGPPGRRRWLDPTGTTITTDPDPPEPSIATGRVQTSFVPSRATASPVEQSGTITTGVPADSQLRMPGLVTCDRSLSEQLPAVTGRHRNPRPRPTPNPKRALQRPDTGGSPDPTRARAADLLACDRCVEIVDGSSSTSARPTHRRSMHVASGWTDAAPIDHQNNGPP